MAVPTNAIKEANDQILLMHSKMQELENEITDLNRKLASKEAEKSNIKMQQVVNMKDSEIEALRAQLRASSEKISSLEQQLLDKDVRMEKLKSKSKILDEVVGFQSSLEGLLSYFKIVQEMDIKRNDMNGNLRETEITDGYQSEDDVEKTRVVVNGSHDDTETTVDHV